MKQIILLIMSFFITYLGISQNVGIGTNNPQEKLEVNGKLKIDNIPISSATQFILTTDSMGVISKTFKDSIGLLSPLIDSTDRVFFSIYGELITQGDLVSVGDGRTSYLSVSATSPLQNVTPETTSRTKLLGQKFKTSPMAIGIGAVVIDARSLNNTTMIYTATLRDDNNGLPGSTVLGNTTLVHSSSGSSIATTILSFNPPIYVLPNTFYHLVLTSYDSLSNTSSSLDVFNIDCIPNGYLETSINSGGTWAINSSRDCFIRIYEIQTLAGRVYRSKIYDPNTVMSPNQVSTFNASPYSNFTDKGNAVLGIAKESGVAGETKKVIISGVADIPAGNLSIGTYYSVGWSAGQLGTGATRVGMGIGPTKLLVTH